MTLVITTASALGITVVADRAQSRREPASESVTVVEAPARKLFYSPAANISFACWGRTEFLGNYQAFIENYVSGLAKGVRLEDAAQGFADEANGVLKDFGHPFYKLHRGVHVAGYVDELPCIYHVHSGGGQDGIYYPLRVHKDYPDLHAESGELYRELLFEMGGKAQLRNGFFELFTTVVKYVEPMRLDLEKQFGVRIPAESLRGQMGLDRAFLVLAAGLLDAADVAPQVSLDVDVLAFDQDGKVDVEGVGKPLTRLTKVAQDGADLSQAKLPVTESLSLNPGALLSRHVKKASE